jgi:GNAT superfamily N-acetyltransferase
VTVQSVLALPMVGDVNLFLKGNPSDEDFEAEAEIMIAGLCLQPQNISRMFDESYAESTYRRKGLATEALKLLLSYATSPLAPLGQNRDSHHGSLPLPRNRFVVRIGSSNAASIALFESLGFSITRRVDVFDEVEMRIVDDSVVEWKAGSVRHVPFAS